MGVQRFKVGMHDRLVLDGVDYRCLTSDGNGHVFEDVKRRGVTLAITHAQFAEAVGKPGYGYFPEHYAPSTAKSSLASGVADLSHLPFKEQVRIRWRYEYARRFVLGEADRGFKRTFEGYRDAVLALKDEVAEAERKWRFPRNGGRVGDPEPGSTKPPSGRTLRRDLETLEANGWRLEVLCRKEHRSGNRMVKVSRRVEEFLELGVEAFLTKRRRSVSRCLEFVHGLIRRYNRKLKADSEELGHDMCPELTLPDWTTLNRRIDRLPRFRVAASRQEVLTAERASLALSTGPDVRRPGQRVEIDNWSMPLVVIVREIGLHRVLTKKELRSLEKEKVTVFVCVVYDAASRCVLGLSLSATANTASSLCALELAVSDKSRYAASVGSSSGWPMSCTPDAIVSDAGNEFVDILFRARVLDLRTSSHVAVAAKPFLRGKNERLFGTFHEGFVSNFRGRTFEDPVRRGRYPSRAEASVTVGDVLEALPLYVMDVYHNTPHAALAWQTPAQRWRDLVGRYEIAPPPDRDIRRHVFGEQLGRRTGPHGVTVLGLRFNSLPLHEHFRDRGPSQVQVRVDPFDLGAVSVRTTKTGPWIIANCMTRGFDGISMSEWERMARELQTKHGRDAELTQHVVDAALERIRAIAERHVRALGLGSDRPTAALIDAAERSLAIGFTMPTGEQVRPPAPNLLTSGVACTGGPGGTPSPEGTASGPRASAAPLRPATPDEDGSEGGRAADVLPSVPATTPGHDPIGGVQTATGSRPRRRMRVEWNGAPVGGDDEERS